LSAKTIKQSLIFGNFIKKCDKNEMKQRLFHGFSTIEVQALTGVTANNLRYWYDAGVILPEKVPIGKGLRNARFYTFTQLIEIKAIKALRSNIPVKTIKVVQAFIAKHFEDSNIANKPLIVVINEGFVDGEIVKNAEVFLQCDDWYTQITGKNVGQITMIDLILIPSLQNQINEVIESVKSGQCDSLDLEAFRSRLRGSKHLSLVA
jgi:DNA-binding transcriptional MerR regulator